MGQTLGYRDFVSAFRELGLGASSRVLAHASLSAFGEVRGGAETLAGALIGSFETVIVPSFTIGCMVIPEVGPPNNALDYTQGQAWNQKAEIFHPDMPADRSMGRVAESVRLSEGARRSSHPLLSFAGLHAEDFLAAQSLEDPWAVVGALADADGDLLLLGVDHRVNSSLHYAEQKAGRPQFVRWALTQEGIVECPGWPGCPDGFNAIRTRLGGIAGQVRLGPATLETVPLRDLVNVAVGWIREDPLALLCDRPSCPRCQAIREAWNASR